MTEAARDLIHPVILCGGSGTRLWPRSRPARPKPFLPLLGDSSLFEATLARVSDRAKFAAPIVVSGAAHVDHVRAQGREAGARLIVEPAARNTAPAIALAAATLPDEAVMLVCPSDHHIADTAAFLVGVSDAVALARAGHLVAFGIAPDRAETGYGYIERGAPLGPGHAVARFVEKPDAALARAFLAAGTFVWNGGIFVFNAGTFRAELVRHRPEMAALVDTAMDAAGRKEDGTLHPDPDAFGKIAGESIDYAVMEATGLAAMVSADMGWSDIGDWRALMAARTGDEDGNVVRGRADLTDCRRVMVDSDGPRVSVVGLEDVIVVVDGDEVLITARQAAQAVGKLPGASGQ